MSENRNDLPVDIDFEADAGQGLGGATEDKMNKLRDLATKFVDLNREIENLEQRVKDAKSERFQLASSEIPNLMTDMGMKSFETITGAKIEIEDIISGSIPKERSEEAMKWLRENGHAGIIRNVIEISLPKGKDEKAQKILAQLKELDIEAEVKDNVHWKTLTSWAKEQLKKGKKIPTEILGLFIGKTTKLSL